MRTIYNIEKPTNTRDIKAQRFFAVAKEVERVIRNHYFIADREKDLNRTLPSILGAGFYIDTLPMGLGGVGQIKNMKDGSTRIQIGYGTGRYNYASCVVVK